MPEKHRGIGSEGLEQGGPDLGNDYSRSAGTGGSTSARDAIVIPHTEETTEQREEGLNMDSESSRNLTGEFSNDTTAGADLEDDDDEMMEDDELQGMDAEEEDEDDDENDII